MQDEHTTHISQQLLYRSGVKKSLDIRSQYSKSLQSSPDAISLWLCWNVWTGCVLEDVEVFLIVQISVRFLGSHFHLWQVLDCCLGQHFSSPVLEIKIVKN